MSNKHLRRVLLEREKMANETEQAKDRSEHDDSDERFETNAGGNKFAALGLNSESDVDDDSEDYNDAENAEPAEVPNATTSTSEEAKRTGRGKKKNRKKKSQKPPGGSGHDEDDLLFAEPMPLKDNTTDHRQHHSLWKIDPRALDGDFELKRLLGRSFGAIAAERREQHVHGRLTAGKMVKAKPEWPPVRQTGIAMIAAGEMGGQIRWFRFQHNQRYQMLQRMFWLYQRHQDHETIMNSILPDNPYHLDSLLTLADILHTLQEDYQQARDVLERGLYACEIAFHSQFQLLSPLHCLSYRWRENRAFLLLLHRHMQMLAQRRCLSTALQFAKILLMKSMEEDPFATILLVDSLALRAREYQFLKEFYDCLRVQKKLDLLPNFLYSISLVHLLSDEDDGGQKAKECLLMALLRFPFVLGQILDKLQIYADNPIESNYSLNSLAIKSVELWKQPDVIAWLESTVRELLPQLISKSGKEEMKEWAQQRKGCFVGIPFSVKRHSLLHSIHFADIDTFDRGDGVNYLTDPYPPKNTQADYAPADLSHISGADLQVVGEERSVLGGLMRSLVPDDLHPRMDTLGEMLNHYATSIVDRVKSQLSISSGVTSNTDAAGERNSSRAE